VTAPPAWDPEQYNRFASQREAPFWDLCALLEPADHPVVVDLGCGDGRLTACLHDRLGARSTLGIDSSKSMLAAARRRDIAGLTFVEGDISAWNGEGFDVVFTNAALQWVSHHETVLARLAGALRAGGQLAFQVPANADHPSHRVARELAGEWLGENAPADPVLENVSEPQRYAQLLHDLGFSTQHVRLQVYGHVLDSSADVVEWVKGTSLTRFKGVFTEDEYRRFLDEYKSRLIGVLGNREPFFYPFKRIMCWGRMAG